MWCSYTMQQDGKYNIVYEYTIVYMNTLKLGQDKYKGVIMTSSGNTCQIDCYFVDNIKPIRIAMLITISR